MNKFFIVLRNGAMKSEIGYCWIVPMPEDADPELSVLLENGLRIGPSGSNHEDIRSSGEGRHSIWDGYLYLSTSDNSDPRTNGREYALLALDTDITPVEQRTLASSLWLRHKDSAYFLARGGNLVPPPRSCNITLTNKCNLRCEMCGSQRLLDVTKTPRRHMDLAVFESVAKTLLPFMAEVELNSQGDPLLYPHITRVLSRLREHRCRYALQTNGTLLFDPVLEQLLAAPGMIKLSLDAVGPRLNEVRRGADWATAEPQLHKLLSQRNPAVVSVWLYPTITARTLQDMPSVVAWAHEHNVDGIVFHPYDPVEGVAERRPSDEEITAVLRKIGIWAAENNSTTEIRYLGVVIHAAPRPRLDNWDVLKESANSRSMNFPLVPDAPGADPEYLCPVPTQHLEVGLDGQITLCCRSQDLPMGFATSSSAFADAWLGSNYHLVRKSLRRDVSTPLPVPHCLDCIRDFAPKQLNGRIAIDYSKGDHRSPSSLHSESTRVPLVAIAREEGYCFTAQLPLGLDAEAYELTEDGSPLTHPDSDHDAIRKDGQGRYSLWGRTLYFSSSDNRDPLLNGRYYQLERKQRQNEDGSTERRQQDALFALVMVTHEEGHCFTARLPLDIEAEAYELTEDGIPLSHPGCDHAIIREEGCGKYSIWYGVLYFSSSDNYSPLLSGRRYQLERKPQCSHVSCPEMFSEKPQELK